MSLSEITDPRAVERAIEEFDQLTRDAFLRKYGFGRSLKYFVVRGGRRYDSKAILGAAHGFQHRERGPLKCTDFNGGEAATVLRLRSLGFEVAGDGREPTAPRSRQFWTLVANPDVYDVDAALDAGPIESWSSRGKPMRPGDGVILWRTRGRGRKRGIVAIGEVVGEPFHGRDDHDPFWRDRQAAESVEDRIPVRLTTGPALPLWTDGPHGSLLGSLAVARAQGGTVFSVTPEQWSAIERVLGREDSDLDLLVEEAANPYRQRDGQGWGLSATERRAVELRAMEIAKQHYARLWDVVEDVASSRCYDLECRSGNHSLRVEVKGTTGAGESVMLTANEVEHARSHAPHVALFVVSGIRLHRHGNGEPVAEGGTVRVYEPWDVRACELRPLAYNCTLP